MSQTQITNGLPSVTNPQGNGIDQPIEKNLGTPAARRSGPALDFQFRREVKSDEGPIRLAE